MTQAEHARANLTLRATFPRIPYRLRMEQRHAMRGRNSGQMRMGYAIRVRRWKIVKSVNDCEEDQNG